MKLLQMCDETPATVTPDMTVAEAIQTMIDRRVGAVAVVDPEFKVVGIFRERDVLKKVALNIDDPHKVKVSSVMTMAVEMATNETTSIEALNAMLESHFRHRPIVDKNGRLLGVLSIRNILEAKIDELSQQLQSLEQYVSNDDNIGG
jgi:CBS domain-containing protein